MAQICTTDGTDAYSGGVAPACAASPCGPACVMCREFNTCCMLMAWWDWQGHCAAVVEVVAGLVWAQTQQGRWAGHDSRGGTGWVSCCALCSPPGWLGWGDMGVLR
eukprot:357806-Chlamydomonas_euryale.AAC.15